jgi:gliding motility-associated lipoprotein GldB
MLTKNFNFINITIYFGIAILFLSCNRDPLRINVSDIDLNLELKRFEQDLFAAKPVINNENINQLEQNYPVFIDLFTRFMLGINDESGEGMAHILNDFVNDPDIVTVYADVNSRYTSLNKIKKEIEDGFKHYKYYFPEKPVPEVVTFISGMQYSVIAADSLIGIGLDMYLGENFKFYDAIGLPKFKTSKMTEDFIVVDCFKGWAQSEYEQDGVKRDLLSQIIYNGKILYFIEAMRPMEDKNKIIGYTKEQLEWCRNNEASIWSFFVSQNLLYSSDQIKIARFINEGPGTGGFSPEAPAMLGNYIGWQIVKSFKEKNKNLSLAQLMEMNDAQQILNLSGYKPKK